MKHVATERMEVLRELARQPVDELVQELVQKLAQELIHAISWSARAPFPARRLV